MKKYQIFNWPNGIIFALTTFMIFIISLIYIYQSNNNVFDLVTEQYYDEELIYQNEINAYKRTKILQYIPTYSIKKEGLIIQFPKNFINSKIHILLQHPYNKSLDINLLLINPKNNILIPSKLLKPTLYLLKIKWIHNNLNYRKDYEIQWKLLQ